MTVLRNIVLLAALAVTLFVIFTTLAAEEPTDEANRFLKIIQSGDMHTILLQFGDNTCGCQPRGGYEAFIRFESGEPDNLAFLMGKQFSFHHLTQKWVPTRAKFQGGNLPWENPESNEVRAELKFDQDYKPVFLPMDMAFGYPVKQEDLEKFCNDPSEHFERQIALRLRPDVKEGVVGPPRKQDPFMADYYKKLLPPEETRYLRPLDASAVTTADGKQIPATEFAAKLPRLKEAVLKLLVVRRGKHKHWHVKKGAICDPVFELADGKTVTLKGPEVELVPGSARN